MSRSQKFLMILGFASLGIMVSPFIFFVLPSIIFGQRLAVYLLGLLPVCSILGMVLGIIVGVIIISRADRRD